MKWVFRSGGSKAGREFHSAPRIAILPWEVPKAYHKFYMMAKVPGHVPAGWQSPVYTVILRCFESENVEAFPAKTDAEASAAAAMPVAPLPLDGLTG